MSRRLIPYAGKEPAPRSAQRRKPVDDGLSRKMRKRLSQMVDYDFTTDRIVKQTDLPRETIEAFKERYLNAQI